MIQKGSVAQLVEWQIRDLKEVGSNPPCVFGDAAAEFAAFDPHGADTLPPSSPRSEDR